MYIWVHVDGQQKAGKERLDATCGPRLTRLPVSLLRRHMPLPLTSGNTLRRSHENEAVNQLYKEFLGEPLSHRAHELLHTHYVPGGAEADA